MCCSLVAPQVIVDSTTNNQPLPGLHSIQWTALLKWIALLNWLVLLSAADLCEAELTVSKGMD